jgi:hypothetical protein
VFRRTLADTRDEVIEAENIAAKRVPAKIHKTPMSFPSRVIGTTSPYPVRGTA